MAKIIRGPSILIPYTGPCLDEAVQDIAIYLRPESNGVKVESTILQVIHENPAYKKALQIVYLANIPGNFIVQNHVIEEHYALKIRFAKEGKEAFTKTMQKHFECYFANRFERAPIIGAFKALEALNVNEDELFRLWVPKNCFALISGQSIKKAQDYYIVNYDIPALLHKNTNETDIFSMILRSFLPYRDFHLLVKTINQALEDEGIIKNPVLYSHVFHYSKGPFEQILDGIGYVYTEGQQHIDLSQLSFFAFLLAQGCKRQAILDAIRNPIMNFRAENGKITEKNLFIYTYENSYREAHEKYQARVIA